MSLMTYFLSWYGLGLTAAVYMTVSDYMVRAQIDISLASLLIVNMIAAITGGLLLGWCVGAIICNLVGKYFDKPFIISKRNEK